MRKLKRKIKFAATEKEISVITKGFGFVSMSGLIVLLVVVLWSWYEYREALAFVKSRADALEISGDDSTVKILADSLKLKINQTITKDKIVEYLRQIEYVELSKGNKPGTFWFDKPNDNLQIISRYPEFPSLKVKFKGDTIVSLQNLITGGQLQIAEIEPRVLGSYLADNNPKELGAVIHEKVTFDKDLKNSNFLDALLIVENRDFFDEPNGISWKGIGRAFLELLKCIPNSITGKECSQSGGSTISAQFVKNFFLTQDRTFSRKYREFWLTIALEKYLNSKERILELYINNTVLSDAILPDFAERKIVGFPALSKYLYGKPLNALSPQEAVTLACFAKSPNGYLRRDEDGNLVKINKLLARRDKFLDNLHESNSQKYTSEMIKQAKAEEIKFNLDWQRDPLDKASATFAALTEKEVETFFKQTDYSFKNESVRVYTKANPQAQIENHQILRDQLPKFAEQIRSANPTSDLKIAGSIVIYDGKKGNFLSINSLELEDGIFHLSRHAFNSNGLIMSEIKPYIYSYGLEKKKFALSEHLDPQTCRRLSGWSPEESDLRPLTFGQHLVSSNNLAPLCILQKIGLNDFSIWWQGISGKSGTNDFRIANGLTAETNLSAIEMARLFGMFVNHGKLLDSRTITKILVGEQTIEDLPQNEKQAIQANTAKLVANQLQAVVNENVSDGKFGTARTLYNNAGLQKTSVRLFGKTGSGPMDYWCVLGYGADTVIVIRLTAKTKSDESLSTQGVFAANTAAKVAEEVLKQANSIGLK